LDPASGAAAAEGERLGLEEPQIVLVEESVQ
jgi:hypothetical protein